MNLLPKAISKINLIPYNEFPGSPFKRPSEENISWFYDQLNDNGFQTTIRATRGKDISAACGQLKTIIEKKLH